MRWRLPAISLMCGCVVECITTYQYYECKKLHSRKRYHDIIERPYGIGWGILGAVLLS